MHIHLITSDPSAFSLLEKLTVLEPTCVIVPANRRHSDKIAQVRYEANKYNVPVFEHQSGTYFDSDLPSAEAAISWLYSQIIKNEDLLRYRQGILNMHGGKIPEYRGASVLQWAIINGERELGITWHEMVEEVDAGMIWAETVIPILSDFTALEMRRDMIQAGRDLFSCAWRNFISRNGGRRPDLSAGHIWPQRRPADSKISSGLPERKVRDMIRALCAPWPPAFLEQDGQRITVIAIASSPSSSTICYHTSDGQTLHLVRGEKAQ